MEVLFRPENDRGIDLIKYQEPDPYSIFEITQYNLNKLLESVGEWWRNRQVLLLSLEPLRLFEM